MKRVLTVGIDLGTSTTKLAFSHLTFANTSGYGRMPRIKVVERQVFYRSSVTRTPLRSECVIDMGRVWRILDEEYRKAGICRGDVHAGAVIITGETATKHNAKQAASTVAEESGDFVVAIAGPDLEGILAGKGSGAAEWSRRTGEVTANIDIGGGTTNIAVFADGDVIGTCTLQIGGRMLCFADGHIARISAPLAAWSRCNASELAVDRTVEQAEASLRQFADGMTAVLGIVLKGHVGNEEQALLLGHPPNWTQPIQTVMFSGGVGAMMERVCGSGSAASLIGLARERAQAKDGFADAGVLIAHALVHASCLAEFRRVPALETMRATVIGAGTQAVNVSGATVHVDRGAVPQRNLPVIACLLSEPRYAAMDIAAALERGKSVYDPNGEGQTFALSLRGIAGWGFADLQTLAIGIWQAWASGGAIRPAVVMVDGDVGKALGQCLTAVGVQRIVCIDEVHVEHGDYVDIGVPLDDLDVVPIQIKTLIFAKAGEGVAR